MTRHLWFALLACSMLLSIPTTTAAASGSQTIFVDAGASANGDGSSARPFRSVPEAIDVVEAGDVISVSPGTYPALTIRDLSGTAARPVVITGDGNGSNVVFTDNVHNRRHGILIQDSSHLVLTNVTSKRSISGVMIQNSSNIVVDNVRAIDTGQEGMHIQHGSHDITIQNSFIADTGKRTDKVGNFPIGQSPGEGIYIGSGRSNGQDRVWNIDILNNEITRTNHEAIDVKAPAHDILISGNHIHNINTYVSGAIVFHLGPHATPEANIVFERNIVDGVTTTSEHKDGNCLVVSAAVQIHNNVIVNCEHRGVFVQDGFPRTNDRAVDIFHNTFFNTGSVGTLASKNGTTAILDVRNNLGLGTNGNRSATANDFVSAPSGDFRLRSNSGAVDGTQPVAGISTDFASNPRVSGQRADFGALELVVSAPTTSPTSQTTPTTQATPTTQPPVSPTTESTARATPTTESTTMLTPPADQAPSATSSTAPASSTAEDTSGETETTPPSGQGTDSDPTTTSKSTPAIVGGTPVDFAPEEVSPLSAGEAAQPDQTGETEEAVSIQPSEGSNTPDPATTDRTADEDSNELASSSDASPADIDDNAPSRLALDAPSADNDDAASAAPPLSNQPARSSSNLVAWSLAMTGAAAAVAVTGSLVYARRPGFARIGDRLGRR